MESKRVTGVILLRHSEPDRPAIIIKIIDFLKEERQESLRNKFITISLSRIEI